jgi:acetyl-CoA carboxylase biotin carboxyl carrier protein
MNPDEIQELKQLIEFLKENNIGEFDLERGDLKVRIKFASETSAADLGHLSRLLAAAPVAAPAAATPPAAAPPETPAPTALSPAAPEGSSEDASLHMVKSPIVGTFYESPSPGTPAFVKPGDIVENGQVLCIIEAMKLMNEIESDASGEIVKRLVQSGQPVEYGQPLFAVRLR